MSERLDPNAHEWMRDPRTTGVMDALTKDGGDARFVGGAIRNALLDQPVGDVDIATPLSPAEVTRRLTAAGLTALPTGIEHGTVTAISGGRPYEVTTLRRDVSTDGRRATVAFTTDWNEDARRRDFTMNALYAERDGTLHDPTGGLADLKAGRVRFIGDARRRIREDYLRILRLFRFHAWYGFASSGEAAGKKRVAIDQTALAAAASEKSGIATLSGERIQTEMLKLLAAPDPMPSLEEMHAPSILGEIVPQANLAALGRMVATDRTEHFAPDPVLRLAALLPDNTASIRQCARRFRLSNADRDRVLAATTALDLAGRPNDARRAIYRLGTNLFRDLVRVRWARDAKAPDWHPLLALADCWSPPRFPVDGEDAMAAGIPQGPRVGQILSTLEDEWIDADFALDRPALLARLKALAQSS